MFNRMESMENRCVRKNVVQHILPILAVCALASCCGGSLPDIVSSAVNSPPVAVLVAVPAMAVTQLDDVTGEPPLEVSFDASGSFDADGIIVTFDWDFDTDGTYDLLNGGPTTNHTYSDVGQFMATVRVTDNDGLSDTDTANIQVLGAEMSPPEASGTGQVDPGNPLSVNYDATSSFDFDGEIVQYDWDMDNDGEFEIIDGGPTPSHQFPEFGTYTIRVRVTDNDGFTDTYEIVISLTPDDNLAPSAVLTATPEAGFPPGLEVLYDASMSTDVDGSIVRFDWDMDNDGSFEIDDGGPTQGATYDADGVFTVNVRVTDDDGATDTASAQVTVGPIISPTAVLVATPDSGLAPGLDVVFDASGSSDPDGSIVSYDWDMDNNGSFELFDGGVQQFVTYDSDGFFTVRVRVTDNHGASDIADASVTVGAIIPPNAMVHATPDSGNAPLDVVFDATASTDPDGTIVSYDWDMNNDGTFEVLNSTPTQNANYQSGGLYTIVVRVTDNDGASDTATVSVNVNNPPTANLVANPESGNVLDTMFSFDATGSTDTDGTIVSYDWDMDGDGTYETINAGNNRGRNFNTGGIHTVSVRVTDNDGASDTATVTVDVNNPPTANLIAVPPDGTAPLNVTFDASGSTDTDGSIVQYDWDMENDGTFEITDGEPTQAAFYPSGGFYQATVRVTDDDGATSLATTGVSVNNAPNAVLVAEPSTGTAPLDVAYDASGSTDSDGNIVSYDWDMNDDGVFEILDGTVTQAAQYTTDGLYSVILRVTDNDGGTDVTSATVVVITPPTAVLDGVFDGESQIYWDASASFDTNGTIVQYDWDTNNDGTFDTIDYGPTYVQQDVGYYEEHTYGVRVTDNDGLTDTDYFTVNTDYPQ